MSKSKNDGGEPFLFVDNDGVRGRYSQKNDMANTMIQQTSQYSCAVMSNSVITG